MSKTPKLRFKEFSGDWKNSKLSEEIKFVNGKAHEKDIVDNGVYVVVNSKFISTEGLIKKYSNTCNCNVKKNDILMVMSDIPNGKALAKCFFVKENNKYTLNQRVCALRDAKCNSKFLYYTINRNKHFLKMDDGVSQTNLKKSDILNCKINLPSLPEQEKIASFFSLIDEKISLQSNKVDNLKEYKKGMMQKIFSRELRFKDDEGRDYPEWEEKKLKKVCYIQGGYAFKSSDFKDVGTPIIRISNMDYNVSLEKSKTVYTNIVEVDPKFEIKQNSILIAMSGSTGKIGLYTHNEKAYLNQRVGLFVNKDSSSLNYSFLHCLMRSYEYKSQISRLVISGVQSNISPEDIENLKFKFPIIKEQEKIADFLSTIDSKVELEERKLEQLKEMKKGFLQQMFV